MCEESEVTQSRLSPDIAPPIASIGTAYDTADSPLEQIVGKSAHTLVANTNRPALALSRRMHIAPTAVTRRCIRTAASSSRAPMGMPRPLLENARRPPLILARQSTTMDVNLDACVPANIPAVKGQKRPCRTNRTEPGIQPFHDLATLDLISFISFY